MTEASPEQVAGLAAHLPWPISVCAHGANHYIHRRLPDLEVMLRIMPGAYASAPTVWQAITAST
ncbi:MAG: hypothetical protein R3B47_21445 [Bacteroidia bacterium]